MMNFDEMLASEIEKIEVPEGLLPENIEIMLEFANIEQLPAEDIPELCISEKLTENGRIKEHKARLPLIRTLAAIAACVAVVGGSMAINRNNAVDHPDTIAGSKTYEAVQQVSSYDELYSIYSGIYSQNYALSDEEIGDGVEISTDSSLPSDTAAVTAAVTEPVVSSPDNKPAARPAAKTSAKATDPEPRIEEDVYDELPIRSDFSDADIMKSKNGRIYYLCEGILYTVDDTDFKVMGVTESEYSPFEMDIYGDSLLLVSRENDFTAAQIYDISAGEPVLIKTYKQNGSYVSSRVADDGTLYIVTSGYGNGEPGSSFAALDTYVPKYYIDGQSYYIEPDNVFVPQSANSIDYTVISAIPADGENISAKAVLGSGSHVYLSDNTLYVTGVSHDSETPVTSITAFTISGGSLNYRAETTLEGVPAGRRAMCQYNGQFRIALRAADTSSSAAIYTLDSDLSVISARKDLYLSSPDAVARFDGDTAIFSIPFGGDEILTVDLNETQSIQTETETESSFVPETTYIEESDHIKVSVSDGILTIRSDDADGNTISVFTVDDMSFVDSAAINDDKALLTEPGRHLVGVPVSGYSNGLYENRYYLFDIYDGVLTLKGTAMFNDLGDDFIFNRSILRDNEIVLVGTGKMVTIDADTLEVKDITEL
ncbi:MAG: beta-propeller domain-containing protein [Oscillospiraceae bacterium]|nr:beta-propeller domain-containing protein [Oscillospiraceae bacterium]